MSELVVAVDIGATNVRAAIFDDGVMVRKEMLPNPGSSEGLRLVFISLFQKLGVDSGFKGRVGVATIGPLDMERGYIVGSPNIVERVVRLSDIIKSLLPRSRVFIANDAVASAWGEYVLGAKKSTSDLGFITWSTGIGGGFVVGGKLLLGSRGNAHEVGHIVLDTSLRFACGCGGRGHWEAIAGGRWIPRTVAMLAQSWEHGESRFWREAVERGVEHPATVFEAARRGDEFAVEVVEYLARTTAAGIASVKASYDVDVIAIGGSVFLKNKDLLEHAIKKYLSLYMPFQSHVDLLGATFGGDAGLYGAYAIAVITPEGLKAF